MSNTNWHDTAMRTERTMASADDWLDLDAMFGGPYEMVAELAPSRCRTKRRCGLSAKVVLAVLHRDGLLCRHCGRAVNVRGASHDDALHLDHVWPVAKGGEDTVENLVVSCARCNIARRDLGLPIGELPCR